MEAVKAWDSRKSFQRGITAPPHGTEIQENGDRMDWEPNPTVNIAAAQRNSTGQTNKSPRL
ncbi:hypothetical protein K3495_g15607 [Podosphaera aphanis]|nr:hypothetical protein K3495_g15607 [Podosphaera aphanis]